MADIVAGHKRPKCRTECRDAPRPCPWIGCRFHFFINITRKGNLSYRWGKDVLHALETMPDTCALDVADRGITDRYRETLEWREIGARFNMTHMAALFIWREAEQNFRQALKDQGVNA